MSDTDQQTRFYHLERQPLDTALPQILAKGLSAGHRIAVLFPDDTAAEAMNQALWTYKPDSFLPHGTARDGHADRQPVYLGTAATASEAPNAPTMLVSCGNCAWEGPPDTIALICELFEGFDDAALTAARARWKTYKDEGRAFTYWQQTDKGWEQKA